MKSFAGFLGAFLMVLSALVAFLGALGMIDPVGTQMSNDADPFGALPSFVESALVTGGGVCAFLAGYWLTRRGATDR